MTVKENKPDCEDTQDIDLLAQILDKLEYLCRQQRRQGEELGEQGRKTKEIKEKLIELEANVALIRQSQVEQGKALANMKLICDERMSYYEVSRRVNS